MLKFLTPRRLRQHPVRRPQDLRRQKPVFGTCAGAILLAKEVRNPSQPSLGILDMGRRAQRPTVPSAIPPSSRWTPNCQAAPLETVFIRAPRIVATGPAVEILAEREKLPPS